MNMQCFKKLIEDNAINIDIEIAGTVIKDKYISITQVFTLINFLIPEEKSNLDKLYNESFIKIIKK